jgi:hypothetical protein
MRDAAAHLSRADHANLVDYERHFFIRERPGAGTARSNRIVSSLKANVSITDRRVAIKAYRPAFVSSCASSGSAV